MKKGLKSIIIFISIFALYLIQSCSSVPITGRKQLSMVSNSEIISLSSTEYQKVLASSQLSNDQQQVQMVKTVGNRIKTAVETYMNDNGFGASLDGFNWEFNLIDEPTVNAWAMPGGKVAFYTGIMPICQDEKGVAVVMGHEVAHAIANHGRERMSQSLVLQFGMSSLSMAMGQDPSLTEQIFLQSVGVGSQLGMLKYGRTHESEADKIGLIFMAIAGYDPRVAPEFWERMNSGGSQQPEWLSTHPSHETRISDLNASMEEALTYYNK